jgi:trehalose-phosphatase
MKRPMPRERWQPALRELVAAKRLLVALDFDGTLAPLVPNPADSRMVPEARQPLERLAALPRTVLALVSGRPVADLAHLADPPSGTLLVGSHGAEYGVFRDGALRMEPIQLSAARQARLTELAASLETLAAQGKGAWVELKPVAAVFHTRPMADRALAENLEKQAAQIGKQLGGQVLAGKMGVEVAVVPAGKAGALARLKDRCRCDRMVFAGDDFTDELALRTIKPPDLGIKVGRGSTAATLRLANPAAVAAFLDELATALEQAASTTEPKP